jgi:hypothetical protein
MRESGREREERGRVRGGQGGPGERGREGGEEEREGVGKGGERRKGGGGELPSDGN